MLQTVLIELIVFAFNLVNYTSQPGTAQIALFMDGKYNTTLEQQQNKAGGYRITVRNRKGVQPLLRYRRIDNGLYRITVEDGTVLKADLASYYMQLNWNKLLPLNKKLRWNKETTVTLTTSKKQSIVRSGRYALYIKNKLLQKAQK